MPVATILEVMIGVVFVYLLLSLILSAVTELIASLVNRRGRLLRWGIHQILQDPVLVERFYAHPFIKSLRQPGATRWNRDSLRDPSYIPADVFAKTVTDLVATGLIGVKAAQAGGAEAAQPKATDVQPTQRSTAGFAEKLRAAPADLCRALTALYDELEDESIPKFQAALEGWFNAAMDRVSGWYKRRTSTYILFLGIPLVIATNADTLVIVKTLWRDPTLRASLVAEAEAFAKEHAAEAGKPADAANDKHGPPPQTPDVQPEIHEAAARLYDSVARLDTISLRLGWANLEDDPARAEQLEPWPGWDSGALWQLLKLHLIGWSVTIFALGMGAPFWFDTLNRLIQIRSSGKVPDKKADEERDKKDAAAEKEKKAKKDPK